MVLCVQGWAGRRAERGARRRSNARTPCLLPCPLGQDRGDLAWWQPLPQPPPTPASGAEEPPPPPAPRPWLPFALEVCADPEGWEVRVREGDSAEELSVTAAAAGGGGGTAAVRAVYVLTGAVAHVRDEDEAEEAGPEYEGHLVAHIQVPPTYFEAQQPSPAGPASSASSSSRTCATAPDST